MTKKYVRLMKDAKRLKEENALLKQRLASIPKPKKRKRDDGAVPSASNTSSSTIGTAVGDAQEGHKKRKIE
jgi:hypothetical protein